MSPTERTARLLAAGAALDDLEAAEAVALHDHRAGCASCRALATELDAVVADLALVAPRRVPPPALLGSVMAAIGATRGD